MFDDLRRKSAEEAEFLRPEAEPGDDTLVSQPRTEGSAPAADSGAETTVVAARRGWRAAALGADPARPRYALGLSPAQRFVLALILFLDVSVLGCFALLAFQRIDLTRLLMAAGVF